MAKKKFAAVLCACVLAVSAALPTFAATTKQDIVNSVGTVQIDGKTKQVPNEYVKAAEDFLNANELTENQLEEVMNEVKEAKNIWAKEGKTQFNELSKSAQSQLKDLAISSAKKLGATITFDGKNVKVVDKNGHSYVVNSEYDNPIKQTGAKADTMPMAIVTLAFLISIGASAAVIHKNSQCKG